MLVALRFFLALAAIPLAMAQEPFSGKSTTSAAETSAVLRTSGVLTLRGSASQDSVSLRIALPANNQAGVQTASKADVLSLDTLATHASGIKRERTPRLAEGMLVAIAVDRAGAGIHWSAYADPRLVRAELAGPSGVLSGSTVNRPGMDLFVDVPNDSAIAEVRVFRVSSGTAGLELVKVGVAPWQRGAQ